jgi:ribosome-associated protein
MELSIATAKKLPAEKPSEKPAVKASAKRRAKAPAKAPAPEIEIPSVDQILAMIETSLDDNKAEDIVTIPLAGKTSMADYMVVATGRSARQVGAMANHLAIKLKGDGKRAVAIEGQTAGDWVLIDCGDIIVHLFRPEVRSFYNIEKMWGMDLPGDRPAPPPTRARA